MREKIIPERFLSNPTPPAPRVPCLTVGEDSSCDILNIAEGAFHPLKGFMTAADYRSVVKDMRLRSGDPWTIPITLEVPEERRTEISRASRIILCNAAFVPLAVLEVEDIFRTRGEPDVSAVYGTADLRHPGVSKELARSRWRVGGPLRAFRSAAETSLPARISVNEARREIARRGWKTIVGFQTRNAPHRAHEHLQRTALETHDGLFIHPLIGWKKPDDFTPDAVVRGYQTLIGQFYPRDRVLFGALRTAMRYAGPREAVFHAIIRRNYGCTHFIIGRDHAGVGGFYGRYAGHELSRKIGDLGIEILRMAGPYFCRRCGQIATERTCGHGDSHALSISGTQVRDMISRGNRPPVEYMRPEVADVLIALAREGRAFCGDLVKANRE